jgi:threonyl-tRNA synthetase
LWQYSTIQVDFNAEVEKIPVVTLIGKQEVEQQTLSVRTRQSEELGALKLSELQKRMQEAIENRQQI